MSRRNSNQRLRNRSLNYAAMEPRQLLAVDFSVQGTTLVLERSEIDIANFEVIEVLENSSNNTLELSFRHGEKFLGEQVKGLTLDATNDVLTIDKALFNDGTLSGMKIEVRRRNRTSIVFMNDVNIPGDLTLNTRSHIVQMGTLKTGDLTLAGTAITLDNANNVFGTVSIDGTRVGTSRVPTTSVMIVDSGVLTLGTITTNCFKGIGESIEINGQVYVRDSLILESATIISESAQAAINTDHLTILANGDVNLDSFNNRIAGISGNVNGSMNWKLTGTTFIEHGTKDDTTHLNVTGDFVAQSEAGLEGTLRQRSDASFSVNGIATFNLADGSLYLNGGDFDGDSMNDNNFNQVAVGSARFVEIVDRNAMKLLDINVAEQAMFRTGSESTGRMSLLGTISSPRLLLQTRTGIQQLSGTVQTDHLFLGGNSDTENYGHLQLGLDNSIGGLSAQSSRGIVTVKSLTPIEFRQGQFNSVVETISESFQGIRVANSFLVTADGIKDDANAVILVSQTADLTSTKSIVLGDNFNNTIIVNGLTNFDAADAIDVGQSGIVNLTKVNLQATGAAKLTQFNDVVLTGANMANGFDITTQGSLSAEANTSLTSTGVSTFHASKDIVLGATVDQVLKLTDAHFFGLMGIDVGNVDNTVIGRVQFQSDSNVRIYQTGFLNMILSSTAANLDLYSTITIRDAATVTLDVAGTTRFGAATGISIADAATNIYHLCGLTNFDVGDFAFVFEPGTVVITDYIVREGAAANLSIDSTVC